MGEKDQFQFHLPTAERGPFDSKIPLISLHIPKCAGQSLMDCLSRGAVNANYRFLKFYPDVGMTLPNDWRLPNTLVHGHFVRWKGHPVEEICENVTQYTTVLRDPYDVLISGYSYGLMTNADWATNKSINDFIDWFLRTNTSPIFGALPRFDENKSLQDYANQFLLIGCTDRLEKYVERLSDILGMHIDLPARLNISKTAVKDPGRRAEVTRFFCAEYEFLEIARRLQ